MVRGSSLKAHGVGGPHVRPRGPRVRSGRTWDWNWSASRGPGADPRCREPGFLCARPPVPQAQDPSEGSRPKVPKRKLPSESSQAIYPEGKSPNAHPGRSFISDRSQRHVSKRKSPIDNSQAKDPVRIPKRTVPIGKSKAADLMDCT